MLGVELQAVVGWIAAILNEEPSHCDVAAVPRLEISPHLCIDCLEVIVLEKRPAKSSVGSRHQQSSLIKPLLLVANRPWVFVLQWERMVGQRVPRRTEPLQKQRTFLFESADHLRVVKIMGGWAWSISL